MYSSATGRVKGLEVERLETRDLPSSVSINTFLSGYQVAAELGDRATTPAVNPPAGSLADVIQKGKTVLLDTGNLATDVGALVVDGSVAASEAGLLTSGVGTPAALIGIATRIAAFEKAAHNTVGIAADTALLISYIDKAIHNTDPTESTNNIINVAVQFGVVLTDFQKGSLGAAIVDFGAVVQDFRLLAKHVSDFDNAVMQFGGYQALVNVGISSAAAFVSPTANKITAGISEVQAYLSGVVDTVRQGFNSLSDSIGNAVGSFDAFLQQFLAPDDTTQQQPAVFDPDDDGDDDSGEPGY